MIGRFALPFGVPVVTGGGSSSVAARRNVAIEVAKHSCVTRVGLILDRHQHGGAIADSTAADIAMFAEDFVDKRMTYNGEPMTGAAEFVGIAVRPEHIKRYNLTPSPSKMGKQRVGDDEDAFDRTVQVEAVPTPVLTYLVRESIARDFDAGVYVASRRQERQEREEVVAAIEAMTGG